MKWVKVYSRKKKRVLLSLEHVKGVQMNVYFFIKIWNIIKPCNCLLGFHSSFGSVKRFAFSGENVRETAAVLHHFPFLSKVFSSLLFSASFFLVQNFPLSNESSPRRQRAEQFVLTGSRTQGSKLNRRRATNHMNLWLFYSGKREVDTYICVCVLP